MPDVSEEKNRGLTTTTHPPRPPYFMSYTGQM